MQIARPRLYLHIGRNKAGSTTLQKYCLDHEKELKNAGVRYALFGYPSPPGSEAPTFPSHMALAEFVRTQQADAVLVSHEGICCFPAEMTAAMAADLSDLNTRVIFYIRPYRDWVVSSYNFDVRIGFNGRDFDRYLEVIASRVSFRPMLEIWGDALGWENIRVRSTDPADLQGGDLVSDLMSAINVDLMPGRQSERLNTAPSWMAIELMRPILGRDQALGWDSTGLATAQVLHHYTDEAIKECGEIFVDATYLTRSKSEEMANLYNEDLVFIKERTGVNLKQDDARHAPERAFLPGAEQVPEKILRLIGDRAFGPNAPVLHPDVANFVKSSIRNIPKTGP